MIYSTIPQKYLYQELTEMFKKLKSIYMVIDKVKQLRESVSNSLLDCDNDGEAFDMGQTINALSTNIKHFTANVNTILQQICDKEKITKEECGNIMNDLDINFTVDGLEELLQLPNTLATSILETMSKRYKVKVNYVHKDVDGLCTM